MSLCVYVHTLYYYFDTFQAVTNQTTENKSKFEEKHFTLSGDSVRVDAGLTNQSDEWVMTSRDSGEVSVLWMVVEL